MQTIAQNAAEFLTHAIRCALHWGKLAANRGLAVSRVGGEAIKLWLAPATGVRWYHGSRTVAKLLQHSFLTVLQFYSTVGTDFA